jgi:mRNA interferase MazF
MTVSRGEIWLAELNPVRGSEQSGIRPVLVLQTNAINRFTTTVLAIPFTTNLRRASLPSCVQVASGEGGLSNESVALCHQLRALDKTRLTKKLGEVSETTLEKIEACVLFTLGIEI